MRTSLQTIASILEQHARIAPAKEAIVCNDVRISYGRLNSLANEVANALVDMGIVHGDKIALVCPNLPFFPIIYYGILKVGAVVVPLNVLFKQRDFIYHLKDSDAKAVFVFEGTDTLPLAQTVKDAFDATDACEHLIVITNSPTAPSPFENCRTLSEITVDEPDKFEDFPTKADDTCAILYTSGTTGQPKGAELTHLNVFLNAIASNGIHLPFSNSATSRQQVCLITVPLFHSTGQTVQMNANIYAGNRVVLLSRFEPQATLEIMEKEKVNFWLGVPTMYWAILKYIEDTNFDVKKIARHLKVPISGGAPMPVEVSKRFSEIFGMPILEGYGLSETSPLAFFDHHEKPSKAGSVGQAIFGVQAKCMDENDLEVRFGEFGEIVLRGHNVMKGYYKRPDETADALRNGWFHTGDIGYMDEEGYLTIVDRKKDMILRGGYNVYPRELEEVIMTHQAVSLVAVIGVPDERLGEEVKAFIVLKQ